MFDEQNLIDGFQTEHEQQTAMGRLKSLDSWLRGLISVCAFIVAGYTAMHGINATLQFRAHGTLGTVTGIAGVIVLEILFLVLSHGLIHGTFKGDWVHLGFMWAAAGLALAFILLNTVIDSQLNAQAALSSNLAFYFQYVMPVASVVVVVLALIGLYFAPESDRERKRGKQVYDYEETVFSSYLAGKRAELATAKIIGNAQLGAKMNAAKLAAGAFNSEPVQAAITQSALGSVPSLLRSIGVNPAHIPDINSNGNLDLDDVAAYLENNPDLAARLFGQARRSEPVVTTFAAETNPAPAELTPTEPAASAANFQNGRNGRGL